MYGMWQSPGGKVEGNENPMKAAVRETEEETGIKVKKEDLEYLFNDPEFNCNVYATKIPKGTKLQQTEEDKNGPWIRISFLKYEEIARQGKTTPTHTTFINEILDRIVWNNLPNSLAETMQVETVKEEVVTPKQQKEIDVLMEENKDRFVTNISETGQSTRVGRTNVARHKIDTRNADPIRRNYYRTTKEEQEFIDREIKKMLCEGIIQASDSP